MLKLKGLKIAWIAGFGIQYVSIRMRGFPRHYVVFFGLPCGRLHERAPAIND
jgi:hypothetical protein